MNLTIYAIKMEPLSKIAVIRLVFHASVTQTAKCMYVTLTYNQKWANIAHFKYATGIVITMDGGPVHTVS